MIGARFTPIFSQVIYIAPSSVKGVVIRLEMGKSQVRVKIHSHIYPKWFEIR